MIAALATLRRSAGVTTYGEWVAGNLANYDWRVRFDDTDGCLGVSQRHEDGSTERVLLSPPQVRALKRFLAEQST